MSLNRLNQTKPALFSILTFFDDNVVLNPGTYVNAYDAIVNRISSSHIFCIAVY
jgi:hypothetical protein